MGFLFDSFSLPAVIKEKEDLTGRYDHKKKADSLMMTVCLEVNFSQRIVSETPGIPIQREDIVYRSSLLKSRDSKFVPFAE